MKKWSWDIFTWQKGVKPTNNCYKDYLHAYTSRAFIKCMIKFIYTLSTGLRDTINEWHVMGPSLLTTTRGSFLLCCLCLTQSSADLITSTGLPVYVYNKILAGFTQGYLVSFQSIQCSPSSPHSPPVLVTFISQVSFHRADQTSCSTSHPPRSSAFIQSTHHSFTTSSFQTPLGSYTKQPMASLPQLDRVEFMAIGLQCEASHSLN